MCHSIIILPLVCAHFKTTTVATKTPKIYQLQFATDTNLISFRRIDVQLFAHYNFWPLLLVQLSHYYFDRFELRWTMILDG